MVTVIQQQWKNRIVDWSAWQKNHAHRNLMHIEPNIYIYIYIYIYI